MQQVNATTHSYTIQPLISADGMLHSPLFIVLQEVDGKFGPVVAKKMKKPPNLYVTCSRSGIATKSLIDEWFKNIFFRTQGNEKHLLCDSLGSYKNREHIDEDQPSGHVYHVHTIPPHTIGFIQPLDVYFFRQRKSFVKIISDYVVMEDIDVNLFHRDEILTLQSLIHDQFSAPIFRPFIRQVWVKCGYYESNENYINPVSHCFDGLSTCCKQDCESDPVIRCSWCDSELYFHHFFIQNHAHIY